MLQSWESGNKACRGKLGAHSRLTCFPRALGHWGNASRLIPILTLPYQRWPEMKRQLLNLSQTSKDWTKLGKGGAFWIAFGCSQCMIQRLPDGVYCCLHGQHAASSHFFTYRSPDFVPTAPLRLITSCWHFFALHMTKGLDLQRLPVHESFWECSCFFQIVQSKWPRNSVASFKNWLQFSSTSSPSPVGLVGLLRSGASFPLHSLGPSFHLEIWWNCWCEEGCEVVLDWLRPLPTGFSSVCFGFLPTGLADATTKLVEWIAQLCHCQVLMRFAFWTDGAGVAPFGHCLTIILWPHQRPWIFHATLSSQMCIAAGLGGSLKCHMEIIPSFSATQTWQSWGHHIIRIFIIDAGGWTYIWHMDVVYVKWVKCQQGLRSGQNVVLPLQDMAWLELFLPSAGTSWFGPFPPPLVPCLSSPFMVFCVDRLRHITRQLQWYEVKNLAVCCPKFQKAKDIMTAGSSVPLQPAWI